MRRNKLASVMRKQIILLGLLLSSVCLEVQAQSWNQYDQGTPPQHAAGVSSLGSYISTDLAANPENGTVCYGTVVSGACQANGYDGNGNLLYRTDARGVQTTITYDALNRPIQKSYNDSPQTPTVNYYYDSQSLPSGAPSYTRGSSTGRLVAVAYGGGSAGNYYGFDALGRVITKYQRTDSVNYLIEGTYYADSAQHTEVYSSVPGYSDRRTVTYSQDSAARIASLSSSATSYAAAASVSSIGYASHNALNTETYGNSLIHAISHNNRLQPTEIKLGTSSNSTSILDLTYSYGSTANEAGRGGPGHCRWSES